MTHLTRSVTRIALGLLAPLSVTAQISLVQDTVYTSSPYITQGMPAVDGGHVVAFQDNYQDLFTLSKFDSAGTLLWKKATLHPLAHVLGPKPTFTNTSDGGMVCLMPLLPIQLNTYPNDDDTTMLRCVVMKLDASGNLIFSKRIGREHISFNTGYTGSNGYSIHEFPNGEILISNLIDNGILDAGLELIKLDQSGQFLWSRMVGDILWPGLQPAISSHYSGTLIAVSGSGEIGIVTSDFSPTAPMILFRLDTNGSLINVTRTSYTNNFIFNTFQDVRFDLSNELVVFGRLANLNNGYVMRTNSNDQGQIVDAELIRVNEAITDVKIIQRSDSTYVYGIYNRNSTFGYMNRYFVPSDGTSALLPAKLERTFHQAPYYYWNDVSNVQYEHEKVSSYGQWIKEHDITGFREFGLSLSSHYLDSLPECTWRDTTLERFDVPVQLFDEVDITTTSASLNTAQFYTITPDTLASIVAGSLVPMLDRCDLITAVDENNGGTNGPFIFPNPVSANSSFTCTLPNVTNVLLLDMQGRAVPTLGQSVSNGSVRVAIGDLPTGCYVLQALDRTNTPLNAALLMVR